MLLGKLGARLQYYETLQNWCAQCPQIALLKLQGYTNPEVADQCRCSLSTVDRRLQLIRRKWHDVRAL